MIRMRKKGGKNLLINIFYLPVCGILQHAHQEKLINGGVRVNFHLTTTYHAIKDTLLTGTATESPTKLKDI